MIIPQVQLPHPEHQYLGLLSDILHYGEEVENRTGVNTLRVLGRTHHYNFSDGFPLFTTKRVWMKGVIHELLWFLSGSTNIKYLVDNGVNIWNDDAYRWYKQQTNGLGWQPTKEEFIESIRRGDYENGVVPSTTGDLGPVYGAQWRYWDHPGSRGFGVDQIANLIDGLKNNPSSRRHIISAWNVEQIDKMALPPCHIMSQFTISKGKLWCHMYQRSCDLFLGVPFNVASYSLLTYLIAQCVGVEPGGFIHTMHDAHIYVSHRQAVEEQLTRDPRPFPTLQLSPLTNIDEFKYFDIVVENYNPHKTIKAELVTG